jgi:hypothetical protein
MKLCSDIAAGGGWVTREIVGRPKARFFGVLSVVWLFVALPASIVFLDGSSQPFGDLEWLCLLLLLPQPVFVGLAVAYRLFEKPRRLTERLGNPEYDPHKLY